MLKNLVLAGGRASRELSVLIPPGSNKVLLRIMGKPVLYYPLNNLMSVNPVETLLIYRFGEDSVYYEASKYGLNIYPIPQREGETTREAILSAESKLRDIDYFFLVFGDIIVDRDAFTEVLSTHLSEEPDATLLAIPPDPRYVKTYGLMTIDENNYVKRVFEPSVDIDVGEPYYIPGGVYIVSTRILDYLEKGYSFPGALDQLARNGRVKAVIWTGLWIDIGYPTDLLEATYQLLSRLKGVYISDKAEVSSSTIIEEPVYIDDNAIVDHNVVIKGPVYIGRNSFIGAYSFLRFYVNIEDNVGIGAYNEIKYSNIQPYVKTHSRTTILDSIIGENTVLESNITTLNTIPEEEQPPRLRSHIVKTLSSVERKLGAIIGYNCKISSHKVLKPGEIIEPNTIL